MRLQTPGPKWTPASRVHISILLGVFLLLKAVAYWLDRYGLAFSGRGIVTGPSYTDVHAVLPAKTILVFVAIICALLFFANSVTRNWTLPAIAFGLMVLSAIVIGGLYPCWCSTTRCSRARRTLRRRTSQRNINTTQIGVRHHAGPGDGRLNYPASRTRSRWRLRADTDAGRAAARARPERGVADVRAAAAGAVVLLVPADPRRRPLHASRHDASRPTS